MIIVISAWREWTDKAFLVKHVDKEWSRHVTFGPLDDDIHFRVGDARGGDKIARDHIDSAGIPSIASLTVYHADWDRWADRKPNPAGAIRNRDMLKGHHPQDPMYGHLADLLIAFPQPGRLRPEKGSGTWNAIEQAARLGIEVRIPGYLTEDLVPDDSDLLPLQWPEGVLR